jgi:hypothetical protein
VQNPNAPEIARTVLEEWMQQAEPPAVQDLLKAVKCIRIEMHNELVEYLRNKFPPSSQTQRQAEDHQASGRVILK